MNPPLNLKDIWIAASTSGERSRDALTFDSAVVGRVFRTECYILDEATVADYARLLGKASVLFPTVPARHTALLRDGEYTIDGGGINARTEVEFFAPPKLGDLITVNGHLVDKYVRRGKPYIVLVAEAKDQNGKLIERVRMTEMRGREEVARKWGFLR